jgi:hypothetical protein
MNEKKLDLNQGDETPSGAGQPEQKTPESPEEEIQDVDIQPDSEEGDDVVLSKEKFQKLVEAKENYKKGLLTYKEKLKAKPKETDYLPKQDFYKANEKTAIDKFVKENPDVENNWSEFVKHYSGKRGKDSVDDIIQDLDDAKTLFSKYNPPKGSEDNTAKANLAKEPSLPSAAGGGEKPQKGGIIPRKSTPSEWYQ